jgi:hypothetical protein
MAVFIWDHDEDEDDESDEDDEEGDEDGDKPGFFAFTVSRPEVVSSQEIDLNDLDQHVSFQVDLQRVSTLDGFGNKR